MGDRGPFQVLGVSEDASFEEIQTARDRKIKSSTQESELQEVEQAYDAILMQRLRLRQEGKIPVPDRIRYPDRVRESPPGSVSSPPKVADRANPLQSFVDTPSQSDILIPLGIMGGLTVLSALDTSGDLPTWAIAYGLFVSIYFLFRKEKRFWRSLLLAVAGLALGLLFSFFAVQGFGLTVGGIANALHVGLCLFVMWIFTSFLR